MAIRVYDFRRDLGNVVVEPEIRARFLRMAPNGSDPGPVHSHDLGGELFLVLEGRCEFLVEDERVVCGPGELIYVEPHVKHTLHAVGDAPCTVYLSVTPHVEPTHTRYDRALVRQPPRFGGYGDRHPDVPTAELARRAAAAARELAERHAVEMEAHAEALSRTDQPDRAAPAVAAAWESLRDVLWQVRQTESAWNALAPRAAPAE